jgi:peptidoglycan hydrolase-like protein with peptidoglycan-binding domain
MKQFQEKFNLEADGKLGTNTLKALKLTSFNF